MSASFTSLLVKVRSCTLCAPHLPHGVRPILQVHPDAQILIAGQAPGKRVHESGIPFQDPSGRRLRDWMGVSESEFYDATQIAILPMGFCYPGTGPSGDLPPRPECAPAWREQVLAALPNIKLTIVLGAYALKYHMPEAKRPSHRLSVTEHVKNWESVWPELLPLPHPSPRNRTWFKRNAWFEKEVIPALQIRVRELISIVPS